MTRNQPQAYEEERAQRGGARIAVQEYWPPLGRNCDQSRLGERGCSFVGEGIAYATGYALQTSAKE